MESALYSVESALYSFLFTKQKVRQRKPHPGKARTLGHSTKEDCHTTQTCPSKFYHPFLCATGQLCLAHQDRQANLHYSYIPVLHCVLLWVLHCVLYSVVCIAQCNALCTALCTALCNVLCTVMGTAPLHWVLH